MTTTITLDALAGEIAATHDLTADAARDAVVVWLGQIWEVDGTDGDEQAITAGDADTVRQQAADTYGAHDDPPALDGLTVALSELGAMEWRAERLRAEQAQLAGDMEQARQDRDDAIRTALAAGVPYRTLGELTGLSRARLDQIRRGTWR